MQKIAFISDIHGNLPAMEAVLEDIKTEFEADQIYCLGDLVDAIPWHNEVIELLRELQIPTILGNHDERVAFDHEIYPLKKHSVEEQNARFEAISYTKQSITKENKQYLSQLPKLISIEHAGISCLLTHGSPNSNVEYVYENHDEELLKEMFVTTEADIILCGHTHLPYIRNVKMDSSAEDKLYINVGSVGRSKEQDRSKATYLQLTINDSGEKVKVIPEIRRVPYDLDKTLAGIKASPIPNFYAEFFTKELEHTQK